MRHIILVVLASLLIAIAFSSILTPVEARVLSPSGCGTATIDGVINAAEWANADTEAWTTTSATGILYMMNDGSNLYMAAIINGDDDFNAIDGLRVYFDNDNGGLTSLQVGDDFVAIQGASMFFDSFFNGVTLQVDTGAGGTTDGQGAGSRVGSSNHFEFSHPLDSGDTGHDFSLSAGQVVGFIFNPYIDGTFESAGWGSLLNPSTWIHDYQVASCATVGGVVYSPNTFGLLSPLLMVTGLISAIVIASFAIEKRRT